MKGNFAAKLKYGLHNVLFKVYKYKCSKRVGYAMRNFCNDKKMSMLRIRHIKQQIIYVPMLFGEGRGNSGEKAIVKPFCSR